jgi:hypothetical protein
MPEAKTTEEKLRALGKRLKIGAAVVHPVTQKELESVRDEVKRLEKEKDVAKEREQERDRGR